MSLALKDDRVEQCLRSCGSEFQTFGHFPGKPLVQAADLQVSERSVAGSKRRWTIWTLVPNSPCGLCGCKAALREKKKVNDDK